MRWTTLVVCCCIGMVWAQDLEDFFVTSRPDLDREDIRPPVSERRQAPVLDRRTLRNRVENWVREGDQLVQSNRVYEASSCYYQALRLNPNHERALSGLGGSCLLAGDAETAVRVFLRLKEIAFGEVEYIFNLASAYLQLGDLEGARKELALLLRYDKKDVRAHYNMGLAQLGLENYEQAIRHFETCLELRETHPFARLGLVRVYLAREEQDAANAQLKRARINMNRSEFLEILRDPVYQPLIARSWIQEEFEKQRLREEREAVRKAGPVERPSPVLPQEETIQPVEMMPPAIP